MATPSANQYFEAIHTGPGDPTSPNLFTAAELVTGSFSSAAISSATSTAVSTVNAAAPDSSSISQAKSQAVSAATNASIADSKAVSNSSNVSVADSKAISVSGSTSIADSKAVSVATAVPVVATVAYSASISIADSKAVSTALSIAPIPSVNVKSSPFNAVGNGVADDTTAFTAALAALSAGGELIVPPGTYIVSPNTTVVVGGNNFGGAMVPVSNITIRGAGKTASIIKAHSAYTTQGFLIGLINVAGVTIRDLGFDGNIANQTVVTVTDNGFTAIKCHNNSTNIEIASCAFTGFTQDCLYFGYPNGTAVDGIDVHDCTFSDFQRGGVTIVSGRNIRIRGNKFQDSTRGLGSVAHGSNAIWLEPNIATDPLENISITGNSFKNLNGGCWLYNAQQTDLFQCTVSGNTFNDVDSAVVGLSAWGVRITGNVFDACGRSGTATFNYPVMLSGSRWSSTTGNFFRNCGSERGDVDLRLASYYSTVSGNTFVGSRRDCIHVEMSGTQYGQATVVGNRIETGGQETVNTYNGILIKCPVGTPSEDGVVSGNEISTSSTTGLKNAIAIEYWQAGVLDDNFTTGTGTPLSITGTLAPGYGFVVWDPANIADGAQTSTTLTIAGANFTDGSSYSVIPPYTLSGITATAYCSAVNTVTILLQNESGGALDLASGTWGVKMRKQY